MRKATRMTKTLTGLTAVLILAAPAWGRDRSPVKPAVTRGTEPVATQPARPAQPPAEPGVFPDEVRTIDGTDNNLAHPDWGSTTMALLRKTTVDYADGVASPAGGDRPSAREISNLCAAQDEATDNSKQASDYLWQWGQFLDHDIVLTPTVDPVEPFDIAVPAGDPFFDPDGTGAATIPLDRSYYEVIDGIRQQVNDITAYIDASNVYGSDPERAEALRALDGSGRLKTSEGNLLPFNEEGLPNAPSDDAAFFLAGDFRANEQVGLTCMHTLFVREHNYWARNFRTVSPALTGDQLYELARAMVGAEVQAITYNEFLPVLLGPNALRPYEGYREDVDAGIANVFATAAYRLGHSMLSSELLRLDRNGAELATGHLALADAFFNPTEVSENGIEPILRGLAGQACQEVDNYLVDDVRNFLFGPPGAGGFDLAALNIQRGRDHGLPGYNQVRADYGLSPVSGWADISARPEVQANLAAAYASPDDVDIWVGLLSEDHLPGAMVGETCMASLKDQFERLRDGDRFWYQRYLPPYFVEVIERQTLAGIIRRNTRIGRELSDHVFVVGSPAAQDEPSPRPPRNRGGR